MSRIRPEKLALVPSGRADLDAAIVMSNRRFYGVILLLVTAACGCSRRTVRDVKQYQIEQFMNTNLM